jgi:hypothetical protein
VLHRQLFGAIVGLGSCLLHALECNDAFPVARKFAEAATIDKNIAPIDAAYKFLGNHLKVQLSQGATNRQHA